MRNAIRNPQSAIRNRKIAPTHRATLLAGRALYALGLAGRQSLSLDGLDAVIRALAMIVIVALSFARLIWPSDEAPEGATYLLVAAALVVYNLVVVLILGVPWRRQPGGGLFLFDGLVALTAILATGGIFSPFIVLTYALAIGATLRLPRVGPLYALAGCIAILAASALLVPAQTDAPKGPVLVVEITSLVMVAITSLSLKRLAQIETERLALEEAQARRLLHLNTLTANILSGVMNPAAVLKTVANAAATVSHSERAIAALLSDHEGNMAELLRTNSYPDPVVLTPHERELAQSTLAAGKPRLLRDSALSNQRSRPMLCIPVTVDEDLRGTLLLWRGDGERYSEADVSLLTAMGQQMALGVRLARLYEKERERALRSEERERLERDLLSLISHDLRTPLTAIRTCVDALAEVDGAMGTETDQTYAKLVRNIDRNAERLSGMVDDLLDMARLRSGTVSLNLAPANLGAVITDLASTVLPLLRQKEHLLELDLPARGSARWDNLMCEFDKRRIEQVILNLFTNAQKFAPSGSTVTVGATERNGEVRVFVRDAGPGISQAEQARIFDRFYSGSGTSSQVQASTSLGLGLAIARSIVEMHGGKIWVQSRPGAGSTFYFALTRCKESGVGDREIP